MFFFFYESLLTKLINIHFNIEHIKFSEHKRKFPFLSSNPESGNQAVNLDTQAMTVLCTEYEQF